MKNIEKQLLHKIKNKYDLFYVAISGGKDSTATLIWALKNLPKEKIIAVFIDIGNESKVTLDYIRYLEQELNHRIIRILPEINFSEMVLKKGFFPSPNVRFCTNLLKIEPAQEVIKLLTGKINSSKKIKNYEQIVSLKKEKKEPKILTITGIRAAESEKRSKYPVYEENNVVIQTDMLRPIIKWNKKDVFDYIKQNNIKINPLYELGCERVGCFPCIFAKPVEIQLLFEKEEFEYDKRKIQTLEKKIGRKFFINKSLEEKYNYIKLKNLKKQESLFSFNSTEENDEEESICIVNGLSFCE